MFRRRPPAVYVLAAWTLFVWGQRIVNIATGSGSGFDLARAILFVLVGLATAVVALVPVDDDVARRTVLVGGGLTIALWAVQIVAIPLRDHPVSFVVVHVVLGAISIGLAAWAIRSMAAVRSARQLPTSA